MPDNQHSYIVAASAGNLCRPYQKQFRHFSTIGIEAVPTRRSWPVREMDTCQLRLSWLPKQRPRVCSIWSLELQDLGLFAHSGAQHGRLAYSCRLSILPASWHDSGCLLLACVGIDLVLAARVVPRVDSDSPMTECWVGTRFAFFFFAGFFVLVPAGLAIDYNGPLPVLRGSLQVSSVPGFQFFVRGIS